MNVELTLVGCFSQFVSFPQHTLAVALVDFCLHSTELLKLIWSYSPIAKLCHQIKQLSSAHTGPDGTDIEEQCVKLTNTNKNSCDRIFSSWLLNWHHHRAYFHHSATYLLICTTTKTVNRFAAPGTNTIQLALFI